MLPQMGRSSEHPAGPVDFEFHEGNGWKIGFDAGMESDETYSAMVGSDDFSIALTRPEFTDFVQARPLPASTDRLRPNTSCGRDHLLACR